MKVVYSTHGRTRLLAVDRWWRANRRDSPELFATELESALGHLMAMGELIGQAYRHVGGFGVRRYRLSKTRQYVYYSVDRAAGELRVHSIWGTARRDGPPLP